MAAPNTPPPGVPKAVPVGFAAPNVVFPAAKGVVCPNVPEITQEKLLCPAVIWPGDLRKCL